MASGQPIEVKRGEARMRGYGRRLVDDPALSAVHLDRARRFRRDLDGAWFSDVCFAPFLEIGAGTCQRSLVLHNDFGAGGAAVDLNAHTLRDSVHMRALLKLPETPVLVCCDAARLPFRADTFRFVFAFQTLHRFPDMAPVIGEAYRVLACGGHLYFDEEPVSTALREWLRGGRMLSTPRSPAQRLARLAHLDKVFWDDSGYDRANAIAVGRPDLAAWQRALAPFGREARLEVNNVARLHLYGRDPVWSTILRPIAGLAGGNVRGLCLKATGEPATGGILDRLQCPDCAAPLARPPARCDGCGRRYGVDAGIVRLLPKELDREIAGTW